MNTRKFMLVGGRVDQLPAAFGYDADLVCLDLEDTVAATAKEAARRAVPDLVALGRRHGRATAVRISSLATLDGLRDMTLLSEVAEVPDMVVLAGVRCAHELRLVRELLLPRHGAVGLQPIIENAEALREVEAIAAFPGVHSISLGGKDLSDSLRVARDWDALLYARGRCVAAAAAAGVPVVDGPQPPTEDPVALRALCERLRTLGFAGKSAIVGEHLPVIAEVWAAPQSPR